MCFIRPLQIFTSFQKVSIFWGQGIWDYAHHRAQSFRFLKPHVTTSSHFSHPFLVVPKKIHLVRRQMAEPHPNIDIAQDHELWAGIGISWSSTSDHSKQISEVSETHVDISRTQSCLSMILRPQLLRATPLHVALSGWCKHWQIETEGCEVFKLSRPVTAIDVFLNLGMETWKPWKPGVHCACSAQESCRLIQGIPGLLIQRKPPAKSSFDWMLLFSVHGSFLYSLEDLQIDLVFLFSQFWGQAFVTPRYAVWVWNNNRWSFAHTRTFHHAHYVPNNI